MSPRTCPNKFPRYVLGPLVKLLYNNYDVAVQSSSGLLIRRRGKEEKCNNSQITRGIVSHYRIIISSYSEVCGFLFLFGVCVLKAYPNLLLPRSNVRVIQFLVVNRCSVE